MLHPVVSAPSPPPVWTTIEPDGNGEHLPAGTPAMLADAIAMTPTELAFMVVAMLRAHPHVSNVLTHISRGNWTQVEAALGVILDPDTHSSRLSPLARNIVDLMCADRGVTGRIFKPYYQDLLTNILGKATARRLIANVTSLFVEMGRAPIQSPPSPKSSIDQRNIIRSKAD